MKFWTNKWLLLLILTITWGSSFIMIKQALIGFKPLQVGAARLTIAGLALAWFGIRNLKIIPKESWPWVITVATFGNFIPMFLFPYAQQRVSSSTAGILDSLVPIFVLLLGYLIFGKKSRFIQIIGALIGFGGAYILMKGDGGGESGHLGYSLLIVLATVFYGISSVTLDNRLSHVPSFELSSVIFLLTFFPAVTILFFSGFFVDFQFDRIHLRSLGFIAILGIVGTAVANILFYRLIQATDAVFASIVTYLMPIVAVMWGFLADENLTIKHAIGGALILMGVYLIQKKETAKA